MSAAPWFGSFHLTKPQPHPTVKAELFPLNCLKLGALGYNYVIAHARHPIVLSIEGTIANLVPPSPAGYHTTDFN